MPFKRVRTIVVVGDHHLHDPQPAAPDTGLQKYPSDISSDVAVPPAARKLNSSTPSPFTATYSTDGESPHLGASSVRSRPGSSPPGSLYPTSPNPYGGASGHWRCHQSPATASDYNDIVESLTAYMEPNCRLVYVGLVCGEAPWCATSATTSESPITRDSRDGAAASQAGAACPTTLPSTGRNPQEQDNSASSTQPFIDVAAPAANEPSPAPDSSDQSLNSRLGASVSAASPFTLYPFSQFLWGQHSPVGSGPVSCVEVPLPARKPAADADRGLCASGPTGLPYSHDSWEGATPIELDLQRQCLRVRTTRTTLVRRPKRSGEGDSDARSDGGEAAADVEYEDVEEAVVETIPYSLIVSLSPFTTALLMEQTAETRPQPPLSIAGVSLSPVFKRAGSGSFSQLPPAAVSVAPPHAATRRDALARLLSAQVQKHSQHSQFLVSYAALCPQLVSFHGSVLPCASLSLFAILRERCSDRDFGGLVKTLKDELAFLEMSFERHFRPLGDDAIDYYNQHFQTGDLKDVMAMYVHPDGVFPIPTRISSTTSMESPSVRMVISPSMQSEDYLALSAAIYASTTQHSSEPQKDDDDDEEEDEEEEEEEEEEYVEVIVGRTSPRAGGGQSAFAHGPSRTMSPESYTSTQVYSDHRSSAIASSVTTPLLSEPTRSRAAAAKPVVPADDQFSSDDEIVVIASVDGTVRRGGRVTTDSRPTSAMSGAMQQDRQDRSTTPVPDNGRKTRKKKKKRGGSAGVLGSLMSFFRLYNPKSSRRRREDAGTTVAKEEDNTRWIGGTAVGLAVGALVGLWMLNKHKKR